MTTTCEDRRRGIARALREERADLGLALMGVVVSLKTRLLSMPSTRTMFVVDLAKMRLADAREKISESRA